jgi:hypothetical protein
MPMAYIICITDQQMSVFSSDEKLHRRICEQKAGMPLTEQPEHGLASRLTFAPPDKITWPKSFWTPKGYLTSAAGGADPAGGAGLLLGACCCRDDCLMSPTASPSSRHRPATAKRTVNLSTGTAAAANQLAVVAAYCYSCSDTEAT